jgi:hypothetical protein
MDGLVLVARCLLAAVLLGAAVARLLDLDGSRRAAAEFGVADRLARKGGLARPAAELSVAPALLLRRTPVISGSGAVALSLVFIGGVECASQRTERRFAAALASSSPSRQCARP